ncbi:Protein of unknown function [Saccharopolyspora kobensis]|uniref:DUF3168 domain-containing protein n=1 Tax=Saccharopolyspora kobensis TaxID=146035 RepID=A0A1H6EQ51_9PSEU|nr:DUF3168 domain-containing protein [Saccharopolyspora kobensis]SEG98824.1 Protein of unknown function [Saccharopolyspora kobensis]SFD23118.1 Protein of unknown function [Saccharopolyspora kobensis]
MSTAAVPLLTAIFARLSGSAALQARGVRVYDEVPETAVTPYVTLGDPSELPSDQHDAQGLDVDLDLHVWSRYRGYKEAAEIVALLHAELDRKPLPVDGFTNVSIAAGGARYMRDPDPELRHGVAPFRVWLTVDSTP